MLLSQHLFSGLCHGFPLVVSSTGMIAAYHESISIGTMTVLQTLFGTKMDALFFQKQSLEKFSSKLSAKKKKKQNKTKTTSTRKPKFVKQTFLVENLLVLCIHELNE